MLKLKHGLSYIFFRNHIIEAKHKLSSSRNLSKDDLLTYYFSKFVRSIILDKTAGVHLSVTAVAILKSNNFVGQGIADSVDVEAVQSEAKKLYEKYSEDARKKSEGSLTHGKKRSSEKSDSSAVPNKVRKIDSEQKCDSQAPKGDEKKQQPSFESSMLSISKSSLSNPNKGKGTSSTYLKELMSRETKRKVLPATAVAMDKNAKTLAGFNVGSKACNNNDTENTLAGEKGVKAVAKESASKQTNVAPSTTENTSVSMNATGKHDQVWPLTQFFCFLFVKTLSFNQSMTLHRGNAILFRSSQQLPRLRLRPSTRRQQQLTQTLIVRLLKTHFFTSILDFEKSTQWN